MGKEKYYTPTIEEFHVGFEFEYYPRARGGLISFVQDNHKFIETWYSRIFREDILINTDEMTKREFEYHWNKQGAPEDISDLRLWLRNNALRVKHLDQHDIESLGWKANFIHSKSWEFGIKTHQLFYSPNNKGAFILKRNIDHVFISCPKCDEKTYPELREFNGYVKNKSELARLMKQLNIAT